jgi:hypothetical protein
MLNQINLQIFVFIVAISSHFSLLLQQGFIAKGQTIWFLLWCGGGIDMWKSGQNGQNGTKIYHKNKNLKHVCIKKIKSVYPCTRLQIVNEQPKQAVLLEEKVRNIWIKLCVG